MKKVCVTGYEGKIGSHLLSCGYEPLVGDITQENQIRESISSSNPDIIIHCAAMTDVVACEQRPIDAITINAAGTNNIVDCFDGVIIYISTEHVFSGERRFRFGKWSGWKESDREYPVNYYGSSKWAGEEVSQFRVAKTIIVRLSKVFDTYDYVNYCTKAKQEAPLEVSDVVIRGFIHKYFVGEAIKYIVDNIDDLDIHIINIGGKDLVSYYEFMKRMGLGKFIVPRKKRVDHLTPRPYWGGLNTEYAESIGIHIPTLKESIELCL